jgi:hypothetical protein
MTPASQRYATILGEDGEVTQYGDCLAACVASILDCDISKCDDIRMKTEIPLTEFWETFAKWSSDRGIYWMELSGRDSHEVVNVPYYIALGKPADADPRTAYIDHAIVMSAGHKVWDPNPSKKGIVNINWYLIPTISSPVKFLEWGFPQHAHPGKQDLRHSEKRHLVTGVLPPDVAGSTLRLVAGSLLHTGANRGDGKFTEHSSIDDLQEFEKMMAAHHKDTK